MDSNSELPADYHQHNGGKRQSYDEMRRDIQGAQLPYSIVLGESLFSKQKFGDPFELVRPVEHDLTNRAFNWQRSVVRDGGYWRGSFTLEAQRRSEDHEEREWERILVNGFYNWLGNHVEEEYLGGGNALTWRGFVYSITMSAGNSVRRRSYEKIANKVYIRGKPDEATGIKPILASPQDNESILRYGLIEEEIKLVGDDPAMALQQANNHLKRFSTPPIDHISRINLPDTIRLEIEVVGYIHTAGWRLVFHYNKDTTSSYSAMIRNLLNTYCDFLSVENILSFGMTTGNEFDAKTPWEIINTLVEAGAAPIGAIERPLITYWVNEDHGVEMEAVDLTQPDYFIMDGGQWKTRLNEPLTILARKMRPGVVEDTAFPSSSPTVTNLFPRETMSYVYEVRVDSDGKPNWRGESIHEAEMIQVLEESGG